MAVGRVRREPDGGRLERKKDSVDLANFAVPRGTLARGQRPLDRVTKTPIPGVCTGGCTARANATFTTCMARVTMRFPFTHTCCYAPGRNRTSAHAVRKPLAFKNSAPWHRSDASNAPSGSVPLVVRQLELRRFGIVRSQCPHVLLLQPPQDSLIRLRGSRRVAGRQHFHVRPRA